MPEVTINGVKLYYEDTGKGKPIVFLHGYVGDMEDWRPQISLLSSKYRCLAIDQRGRGKAEAPKKPEQYSLEIFADDIYKWLKGLNIEKFLLMGHSLGGMISLQFITTHPEMVTALVLADTRGASPAPSPEAQKYLDKTAELAMSQGTVAAFDWDLNNNPATKARYGKHPDTIERMREKTRTTSKEGYVYVRRASSNWKGVLDKLPQIKVPTLVICGTDDTPFINDCKVLNEKIPGSELVWIKDAGHGTMYEKPADFNSAIQKFITKVNY